jgi:hypothetical protein
MLNINTKTHILKQTHFGLLFLLATDEEHDFENVSVVLGTRKMK